MIFISAQPAMFYFTWQLEIQLYNFHQLGIDLEDIHVLVGYDEKENDVEEYFRTLIKDNKDKASFYLYPDQRVKKHYPSSIRPHLIRKHFQKHPWLENEIIFYHDADIIFRELPDFDTLSQGQTWYVSDTKDYLDTTYIKNFLDKKEFIGMCDLIGISPKRVSDNDNNCGGAQYLLKNISTSFWQKMEGDCEKMYQYLNDINKKKKYQLEKHKGRPFSYSGIQAWCADMWCLFWNALYFKKNIKISKELDFCWAISDLDSWQKKKILHYSGAVEEKDKDFFRKLNYVNYPPFYDLTLKQIKKDSASYALTACIDGYLESKTNNKIDLRDVTFLIPIRIDSESRLENLYIVTQYIYKFFRTSVLIGESDSSSKIDPLLLPPNCKLFYRKDNNRLLHRTMLNNYLIKKAQSSIIVIHDTDVVLPLDQIIQATNLIRDTNTAMVSPYSGELFNVDNLFKVMFGKLLDPLFFTLNRNKFYVSAKRAWGGSTFLSKTMYRNAGLENENISSWGPEDVERTKRLMRLDYKVKRVDGPLFHLPHERKENSGYEDQEIYFRLMEEYLSICNMEKNDLENYIQHWAWNK
ncbi:MAG TPA: galactosyltransferase-related protein [Chitinophagaceae bacterium]|nr:galactosyltransferase-related protein [Chitinophagaceae bacterium]